MNLYNHIKDSGLYNIVSKIKCGVLSTTDEEALTFFNNLHDSKIEIFISNQLDKYETYTINMIHEHALHEDFYVLYIHTKGCTRNDICVNAWVDYLVYFNIDKHHLCMEKLMNHDTVGVNLQYVPETHYSGNFWWSKSSYLKKLDKCVHTCYHSPEFWLTERKIGDHVSLWNSNVDHYLVCYERHNYVME